LSTERLHKKKKKLGKFPSFSIVFCSSLALIVIGVFGLLIIHMQQLGELIKQNVEIHVYLAKYMTEADRVKVGKMLASKAYVHEIEGVPQVRFISKDQAAKEFAKKTGEDFVGFLGDNPLRDAYVIRIRPELFNEASLKKIKLDIEAMPGIFEVEYVESLVYLINDNIAKIGLILIGVALLLWVIVILVIHHTIKLALFSQRFLIRSMQLVGATARFIRTPFLWRSIWYGFLSGLVSVGLLIALLEYGYTEIEGLVTLRNDKYILILMGSVVVMSMLINWLSTFVAIRKYMRLSLDELY
jgi:cell division transport system permease protein